jgi:hypothetical protein
VMVVPGPFWRRRRGRTKAVDRGHRLRLHEEDEDIAVLSCGPNSCLLKGIDCKKPLKVEKIMGMMGKHVCA